MSQAQIVLIVPLGELGVGAGQLPAFGGGGHPDHGLPSGGHPSHGLPGSPGHPSNRPPVALPPRVWPPSNIGGWAPSPGKPSHPIQPPTSGTKPVDPESPLPAGSSLVLIYNAEKGWQGAVVDAQGATKPVEPAEPTPAPSN